MNVLFFCPSYNMPIGGVKQIYRQVDILNSLGFNALVLHPNLGCRESWFQNKTKIAYNKSAFVGLKSQQKKHNFKGKLYEYLQLQRTKFHLSPLNYLKPKSHFEYQLMNDDVLVIPEIYIHELGEHFTNQKVIYIQECFLAYHNKSFETNSYNPFIDNSIVGAIVNSEYGSQFLNYFQPQLKIHKIRHSINAQLFKPSHKKKQIALMSRKLPNDAHQLKCKLANSKFSNTWNIKDINEDIDSNTLQDVASILGESMIFVHLASTEGFGLPAAEAMSSGCLVIGYTGFGGLDYMNPDFCIPIQERDIFTLSKTLLLVIEELENGSMKYFKMANKSKTFINSQYNDSIEKQDIYETWTSILK